MLKRVLIFDDDPDILEVCSICLSDIGFEVFTQSVCEPLLNKIAEVWPDVILLDNKIPDMGGVRAAQLIKNTDALSHIPVIFFSANNNIRHLASEAKADFFIEKPFDLDDLQNMVRKAAGVTE